MLKKLVHPLLALTLIGGAVAASAQPAEAGRRGARIAAGIVGGIVAGAIIAGASRRAHAYDRGPVCYKGPKRCAWRGRSCYENRWGDVVCRGGVYRCWRPTYCD